MLTGFLKAGAYSYTCSGVAQLEASHSGIGHVPEIVAHRSPGLVVADLHTAFTLVSTSLESEVSIVADNCG